MKDWSTFPQLTVEQWAHREVLRIVYTKILNNYRVEELAELEESRLNCVDRIDAWFTLCSQSWSLQLLEDRSALLGIIVRSSSFLERIRCDYVKRRVAVIVRFYSRVKDPDWKDKRRQFLWNNPTTCIFDHLPLIKQHVTLLIKDATILYENGKTVCKLYCPRKLGKMLRFVL